MKMRERSFSQRLTSPAAVLFRQDGLKSGWGRALRRQTVSGVLGVELERVKAVRHRLADPAVAV
jgi:hypothetical protein